MLTFSLCTWALGALCLHAHLVKANLKVVRSVLGVSVAAGANEKEERLITLHWNSNGGGFYYKTN